MFVVDTRLGNVRDDPDLAERVESEGAETITVDGDQRRRSRFRTETRSGREVGVVAEEAEGLRAGDVLAGDGELVSVELAEREALAIDLSEVAGDPETLAAAVELGHRVGNRHRPLATRGSEVLVAVDADAERTEAEVEDGLPDGATTRFEAVDPTLFDHSYAGGAGGDHSHAHGDHGHSHGDHSHGRGKRAHGRGDRAHGGIVDRPTAGSDGDAAGEER